MANRKEYVDFDRPNPPAHHKTFDDDDIDDVYNKVIIYFWNSI